MDFPLSETSQLLSKFRTKFATSCSKNILQRSISTEKRGQNVLLEISGKHAL